MNTYHINIDSSLLPVFLSFFGANIHGFSQLNGDECEIATTLDCDAIGDIVCRFNEVYKQKVEFSEVENQHYNTKKSTIQVILDAAHEKEEQKRQEELELQLERDRQTNLQFIKKFGFAPDSVHNNIVKSQGFTFKAESRWPRLELQVQGTCQKCGAVVFSKGHDDLADLAQEMNPATFTPVYHTCQTTREDAKPTLEQRLLDVLTEFVEEYSYNGE